MASDIFEVEGGHALDGQIVAQGAKNEALQILCVPLLTSEPITISNLPNIVDVRKSINLLEGLGVKVEKHSEDCYTFQADDLDLEFLHSPDFVQTAQHIRGSVMLVGPLLARFGKALLPKPGGDKIGRRRLDTHFNGFIKLGAEFDYDEELRTYSVSCPKLRGTYLLMDEISVTGTANVVMAAVLAEGITQIYNAACEPYVQQLCRLLVKMGAKIEGLGSNLLVIHGVEKLGGAEHRILPDMIEIGSFIAMSAVTRSNLTIKDCQVNELGNIIPVFERFGLDIHVIGDDIYIPPQDYEIQSFIDGSIMTIYDAPWPGFSPDLMSVALVMAIQAKGSVLIHQKMFESRLFFVDKLIDMGAKIILCDPHRATVIGQNRQHQLRGISMTSPDIRAGVALLIAAMSAKGKSVIHNVNQIDRGYQDIDGRLNAIGARITRVKG